MKMLIFSIVACICISLFGLSARADKCPVTIKHLILNSFGATKGFAQYELILNAAKPGPVEVYFGVAESKGLHGHTIVTPEVDFSRAFSSELSATVFFPWQTADILYVAVKKVVRLGDQETTLCADLPSNPENAEPFQNEWRFDDRLVVQRPEVVASVLDPSWNFLHEVQPNYPEQAKDHNVQGTALIAATVGTDGRVLTGSILDYSGSSLFGDAALKAAKASTFKPPLADGQPTAVTTILEYSFTLCSSPPEAGLPPCSGNMHHY